MTVVREDADVFVLRGERVESAHRVHAVAVDSGGREIARVGEPARPTWLRSVAKPMQAVPLVEDAVTERFGLGSRDLALACASHGGEEVHVEGMQRFLSKVEVDEGELACGAQLPLEAGAADRLRRAGRPPGRIHNNCSGKHAGMLALASHHGWPRQGYHRRGHPVQERMRREVSRWTGIPGEELPEAVDGCGVRTFFAPIDAVAGAFARLASRSEDEEGAARVVDAMVEHPLLVGGTGRLCTRLISVTGGRVLVKVGAEGVYGACVIPGGPGVAVKVEDGARRAADPALIRMLEHLGALEGAELEELDSFRRPTLRNTRGEAVGRIEARFRPEDGR